MKPSPDDHHQIEPPKTRANYFTDVDESARPKGSQADGTEDDITKKMARSSSSSFGMGSSPGSTPVSTGGTPIRGVSGKIEPGQVLYSKYQVIKKLGGGAMGDVWLVRHASMGDLHALKLIVSNIASNEVALRRFQREFKVMASLKHPHAVQIYDAAIDDEGGYIDMEYVQGQTIHDLLSTARKRPEFDPSVPLMPLTWIVKVLDQLTDVLQEAHEKGIVHRDLKPGNLMLLDGRKPGKESLKVLDFGIAKIRDDPDNAANQTLTQGFIGTPSYGSPEQAMNRQDIDGRADIYSVGVMLYEFVTGRLPFKGVHFQVMHQHATMPPPPFHEANPKLRPLPELERAILRSLSKDRDQRQQTARDLFEEIAHAVEEIEGPIPGSPPSTWNPPKVPAPPSTTFAEHGTEHDGGGPLLVSDGPDTVSTPVTEPGERKTEDRSTWPDKGIVPPSKWRRTLLRGLAVLVVCFAGAGMAYKFGLIGSTLPAGYKAFEGTGYIRGYPEKVFRESDRITFTLWADGIYLPDGYSAVDKNDLVDGWPRQIKLEGVDYAPRFIRIPVKNKSWMMGAWDAVSDSDGSDAPPHPVLLTNGFYMQENEVTNGEMEEYFKKTATGYPFGWNNAFEDKQQESPKLAREHPAVSISHRQAMEYAQSVRAMLPTEAQWEYAARSMGEEYRYVWGNTPVPDEKWANVRSTKVATTAPVGYYTKDVTRQGLMDMTGNVKEMCRDVWERYPKSSDVVEDPCVTSSVTDTSSLEFVIRGGDCLSIPEECTTTYRDDKRPDKSQGYPSVGFRLVIECPDARPSKSAH